MVPDTQHEGWVSRPASGVPTGSGVGSMVRRATQVRQTGENQARVCSACCPNNGKSGLYKNLCIRRILLPAQNVGRNQVQTAQRPRSIRLLPLRILLRPAARKKRKNSQVSSIASLSRQQREKRTPNRPTRSTKPAISSYHHHVVHALDTTSPESGNDAPKLPFLEQAQGRCLRQEERAARAVHPSDSSCGREFR